MIKFANSIKTLYSKMIHTTCLAHRLHRVDETVRILNPKVDKIISNLKKIFKKVCYMLLYMLKNEIYETLHATTNSLNILLQN